MEVDFKILKGTVHTSQGLCIPMRSSNEEQIYHLQPAHFSVAESCIEDLEGARSSLLHYWAVKLAASEVIALTTCEL